MDTRSLICGNLWNFCLHRSVSTLSQSHKFRSRWPTLIQSLSLGIFKGWSRSQSPNFFKPGVGVPQKMRTPHSCLNCDDTIFSRNSLNRFAILGTGCMTFSHLNVILPFLSDCGILQFTPSLRSKQNGRYCTTHS